MPLDTRHLDNAMKRAFDVQPEYWEFLDPISQVTTPAKTNNDRLCTAL